MPLSPGTRLGPYEIVAPIGAGGMGEVYKAKDTRLDRIMAVKVLRETDPELLRRFEQEARAASALNHPNIVTIYDIGKHEDTPFIAMEYVDGKTLREILASGPLPIDKLPGYATQMAEGLAKAHQAGIVHRDLKPENIVISGDGYVKILDFGLAKLSPEQDDRPELSTIAKETTPGTILGTIGYMSPEQAKGAPADFRSDQFSFGAMLCEMVTGKRAFTRETPVETLAALLKEDPDFAGAQGAIVDIARQCVSKNPGERWRSSDDLVAALVNAKSSTQASRPNEKTAIAVLPFSNTSADPEQEYFCDGMTEELINDLSKVSSLRVISRTSSMQLKGTDKSIRAIGHELNVRYVIEGSVRKAGNNLRISAQLIEARNDAPVWADRYEGTLDDIFDVQEKVSRSIVGALRVSLSPEESQKLVERPIDNLEAFDCYYRARREMLRGTPDGLTRALHDLEVGLDIVGDNVLLEAGLAEAHVMRYEFGYSASEQTLDRAATLADKITASRPDSAMGPYLLGRLERFRGSHLKALDHFQKALELEPNHTNTLLFLGHCYNFDLGRPDLARPLITRALELDPLTPFTLAMLGNLQWMEGDIDDALATYRKIVKLEPDVGFARLIMAYLLAGRNQREELSSLVDEAARIGLNDQYAEMCRFFLAALDGDDVHTVLSDETKSYFFRDCEWPVMIAGGYALAHQEDEAMRWLERAVSHDVINHPLLEREPLLANLRGDARFQRLLADVKTKWDQLRK